MEKNPLKLCSTINGNNIYLKADNEDVFISRCQMLFGNIEEYSLKFDYNKRKMIKKVRANDN